MSQQAAADLADRHSALRLGVMPALLLLLLMLLEQPLPFLAPMFTVMLLSISPMRPPLAMLAKLLLVVGLVSSVVAGYALALAGQPLAFWLGVAALVTWGFARLDANNGDLFGLLSLIIIAMVTVLVQIRPDLPALIPGLMVGQFLVAAASCYLAYALWPAHRPPPPRPPALASNSAGPLWVLGKAGALLGALGFAIAANDPGAILIAATIANLLRDSDPGQSRSARQVLLRGNLLGALAALPLIAIAAISPQPLVVVPALLATTLVLASRRVRGLLPAAQGQTALTVLLVLIASALPKLGGPLSATGVVADRLLTLALTALYCMLVLMLLQQLGCRRQTNGGPQAAVD